MRACLSVEAADIVPAAAVTAAAAAAAAISAVLRTREPLQAFLDTVQASQAQQEAAGTTTYVYVSICHV